MQPIYQSGKEKTVSDFQSDPRDPGRRRALRLLGAGLASVLVMPAIPLRAGNRGRPAWERIDVAVELLDGAVPELGAIALQLPSVTQDGSSVPLTVEANSPMTASDYIEKLYLYAGGNPSPELMEVEFTPLAGKASFSTRIRLDGSQTVVALARTNQGKWLAGSRDVRVTVSGCIARGNASGADDLMRTRVRVPRSIQPGEAGEVRTLINHPMETGLREDSGGNTIPERIIKEFRAEFEGRPVLTARLYRAVAANPYLLFFVAPENPGELLLHWKEDTGETVSERAEIA